jgi:DNA-binding Lrp family transcriptional regulator
MEEIKSKTAKKLTDKLSEKQTQVVIELIKDGRSTDDYLRKALNLGDSTSAGYHRKKLERIGVIRGYVAEIDWEKLGYPTEFIILCEGKDSRSLYEMEKEYIKSIRKYVDKHGEIYITPTAFGKVVIRDVLYCFGEKIMTIVKGHATSDHDVIAYSRQYLLRYPNIEITVLNIKGGCNAIQNFFINKDCLRVLENSFKEVRMR